MDLISIILEQGLTPTIISIIIGIVCVYIYKQYNLYIQKTFKFQEKSYEIIRNIEDNVKKCDAINNNINKNIDDLHDRIDYLENRLHEIEKMGVKSSTEVSSLLQDIESIRRCMETLRVNNNKR